MVNLGTILNATLKGLIATIILLVIYFTIVSLVSGWAFVQNQFFQFWYYIVILAIGFGIQIGLYSYLRDATQQDVSPRVIVTSGATSTAAMVSCCAHYIVNLLPILGAIGIITVISQYQVQFFWLGLATNLLGIIYMVTRISLIKKHLI